MSEQRVGKLRIRAAGGIEPSHPTRHQVTMLIKWGAARRKPFYIQISEHANSRPHRQENRTGCLIGLLNVDPAPGTEHEARRIIGGVQDPPSSFPHLLLP